MNKKDEMFNEFDIDLETANRIAKEYPSLSDSARERMFNMTIDEIGRAISMTAAAVQKRSIRARQKLKKMLAEVGINY